uniref:Ig-like domain-containing protein n=1 Tax=Amphiprion percula TaxID=161767 RepID=A0A3P8SJG8_AMPPE
MCSILTWTCFLLWIGFSLQDKTPDVTVTCFISEECFLPCSFQPGGEETVEWFRQDVVVYKFERSDDDDDSDSSSSKEHVEHDQLAGRASVSPHLVTRGNATLVLRRSSLKDRGTYRCHVHTKRGEHTAKVILKVEEIRGSQGRDLTIPCSAPTYLSNPSLRWSFSNGEDPSPILSYDSRSGHSVSSPSWDDHVELDGFRVPFGDGSLRLMDPKHSEHSGSYICEFSMPHSLHTERSQVTIAGGERSTADDQSHWWIVAVVVVGLVLALVGMLAYLKLRGRSSKPRNDPDEITELHSVKDAAADSNLNESSPFAVGGTNGQSNLQTGTRLT